MAGCPQIGWLPSLGFLLSTHKTRTRTLSALQLMRVNKGTVTGWSKATSRSQTDGAGDPAACTSPPVLLGAPAFLGQVSFPPHFWKSFLNPTLDLLSEDEDHLSHMEQGEPGRGRVPNWLPSFLLLGAWSRTQLAERQETEPGQ